MGDLEFGSQSSQTNDLKNEYLSLPSQVLNNLRLGKDWLAQYQDDMIEWNIRLSSLGSLVSQLSSTIKSPSVCTVKSPTHRDMTLDVART